MILRQVAMTRQRWTLSKRTSPLKIWAADSKVGDARSTGVEAGERIVGRAHRQEQKSLQPSFTAISTSFSAKASNSMSTFPQFLADFQ
jgi:hypothetical protein